MPYSKEHKANTRHEILNSAYRLFSYHGFEAVTLNDIMADCALTRGAFYAHFSSKAELYQQALTFGTTTSRLAELKPEQISNSQWLSTLLDEYLSIGHIRGEKPCPLAFMVSDIAARENKTRATYTEAYSEMRQAIGFLAKTHIELRSEKLFSIANMLIGTVAIARALDNPRTVKEMLFSCRKELSLQLNGL